MKEDRRGNKVPEREPEKGISRRAFLRNGSLAVGAAVLAGGGAALGGCSEKSNAEASKGSVTPVNYTVYDTDLLIVGAGFGGISAGFEAAKLGRNAILVDKGPYGFGGGAGMNWDVVWRFIRDAKNENEPCYDPKWLSNRALIEKAASSDPNIDQTTGSNLLYVLNRGEMAPRRNADGTVVYKLNTARAWGIEGGFPRHAMDELGKASTVTVHDRTMLTDLIVNDGRCLGAMGIHLPTGEFRVYRAAATLCASGANGWIYGWSTVGAKSFQSPDNTSDLEMAALRHGASIGDAEWAAYDLISIYPTGVSYAFNAAFGADANDFEFMYDKDEKKLFEGDQYDKQEFLANRSLFAQTCALELLKGRGTERGGFYVDMSSKEVQDKQRLTYMRSIPLWKQNFGIDVTQGMHEIGFEMYEHGGRPVIDTEGMVPELPGLFHVSGAGVCGILGGNACYIGNRMGSYCVRMAVDYIARTNSLKEMDWAPVVKEFNRVHELRTREAKDGLRPHVVRHKIQEACGTCLGVVREKDKLEAAEKELARIRKEDLPRQIVGSPSQSYNIDWKQAIENYRMIDIAECSVRATLMREETRGQYIRPDFPEIDEENWHCMIVANVKDGEIVMSKRELG